MHKRSRDFQKFFPEAVFGGSERVVGASVPGRRMGPKRGMGAGFPHALDGTQLPDIIVILEIAKHIICIMESVQRNDISDLTHNKPLNTTVCRARASASSARLLAVGHAPGRLRAR